MKSNKWNARRTGSAAAPKASSKSTVPLERNPPPSFMTSKEIEVMKRTDPKRRWQIAQLLHRRANWLEADHVDRAGLRMHPTKLRLTDTEIILLRLLIGTAVVPDMPIEVMLRMVLRVCLENAGAVSEILKSSIEEWCVVSDDPSGMKWRCAEPNRAGDAALLRRAALVSTLPRSGIGGWPLN